MRSVGELLSYLHQLDVRLWADGDGLQYDAPSGSMTPALLAELRERKAELLAVLRDADRGPGANEAPMRAVPREGALPLSFAQQRLWVLDRLDPGNPAYNLPAAVRLAGPLQIDALEQGLNEVVRRHETLRTTFASRHGQPVQIIAPSRVLRLPVLDLQELPPGQRETWVRDLTRAEAQQPFHLAQGPLLRVRLLRLDERDHLLLIVPHHIIFDGWSVRVFMREVAMLYAALVKGERSPLPDPPIQYADYAVWQRQWLQGARLEKQLSYWREQLAGIAVLELPADRPRPAIQTSRGGRQALGFPRALVEGLRELSQQEGVTLFMTLLAAFKILLYCYTGQEDIVVGTPVANRQRVETEGLIGFFANTLALRTNLGGDPTFRELLARVRKVVVQAQTYQELPFERLVEELRPERDLSRTPLFQMMFAMQNIQSMPAGSPEVPGLGMRPWPVDSGTAQFDLTLFVTETEQELTGSLVYNADLFEAETVSRLAVHFRTLLEGMVATKESPRRLSSLSLLSQAERHQLLVEWNTFRIDYSPGWCIHELFEETVKQAPDAVAVVFEEQSLSYRELNRRADQLARYLQGMGIGPEACVGVCMERSPAMIIGLYAILKAGAAYVPLDPAYPEGRLAFMVEDAQMPVVLTEEKRMERFSKSGASVIDPAREWETITRQKAGGFAGRAAAGNLAYLIYTSGSTGTPKGVAIEHRQTVAFIHWAKTIFTPEDLTGVLASTSICFDISVFEIFVCLCCGGKFILAENALRLPMLPDARQVTLLNTVPSAMSELIRSNGVPPSVRTVNLAGEPLQRKLVQEIYRCRNIRRVYNLYGPSEDTTYTTLAMIRGDDAKAPTIGRPIANTQIYLLDSNLHPMPVGVPGELCIGGAGLARGYLRRPGLTAEKFIANPFSPEPGARLYRTGDLARYRSDGEIEFLGRLDHQVKIRGFRIELGEIEAALEQHPAVREVVVSAREDTTSGRRLIAYLAAKQEPGPTSSELNRFLQQKLPHYMVPSSFVMMKALPLLPNGKVDRRALPAPEPSRPELEAAFVAPRTPTEEVIAHIWEEVLGIERIGVYDNFFDLGGHSLLAIQIISRVIELFRQTLSREIPEMEDALVKAFFEVSTVAGLAAALHAAGRQATIEKTAQVLLKLAQLSEEQVEKMLAASIRPSAEGEMK